jgi:hypothetical protein
MIGELVACASTMTRNSPLATEWRDESVIEWIRYDEEAPMISLHAITSFTNTRNNMGARDAG